MNIGDIIILAALAIWLLGTVVFIRKKKKQGGCIGCSGNCGSCSSCERK